MDGLEWLRPYDLNACGPKGQAIAAARGRYFWVVSPDHPNSNFGWADGQNFMGGYSNDPGVLPTRLQNLFLTNNTFNDAGANFMLYQAPWFVCNPDDATTPFYIYGEGMTYGGTGPNQPRQHEEGLAKSADLDTWVMAGPTHRTNTYGQWSSFQRVVRVGPGNWYSTGLQAFYTPNAFGSGMWTSTDGLSFTPGAALINACVPPNSGSLPCTNGTDREMSFSASDNVTIAGQLFTYVKDASSNGSTTGGAFVTRVPIGASFNVLASPALAHISSAYANVYPGPTYLQAVNSYIENGVAHIYAQIGFPPSSANQGLVDGATYANGGGLWHQFIDYYTEIVDPTAAAQAAPVGITASCASGTVTITWLNALPNNTYRVYRGSSAASQTTLVGDVIGTTITDTPTGGQQWWYKVVTLQSGTERQSRIVHVYVSSATAFVNNHIDRVIQDGGDPSTIDATWLSTVDAYLTSNNLTKYLLFWTDPAFGVKRTGNVITKIYDLGTTRLPRGGDYTPTTGTTTYSATAMNGTVPGWTNTNTNSFGYFGSGRLNNIRRKVEVTVVAAYNKPNTNTATLVAMDEFGGIGLQHTSGSPGNASFYLTDGTHTVAATNATSGATAPNIIAGVFDGTCLYAYVEAVASTCQTGLVIPASALSSSGANPTLTGTIGTPNTVPFLGSGSQNSKYIYGTGYVFENNEAQFSASDLIVFEKGLSAGQISSLTTLLRNRIGP